MPTPSIGEREREILTAIVETFISTGEPVGSRTLSRSNREGLSPASIRNVMADLADAGYLEQPHTSAGRVPTPEAYRYYVEQLTGAAHLSHESENIIQQAFHGVTEVQEFMERTSHVLSLISRNVGVAVASSGPRNALEHVYFSRLGDQKVLAVVITRSGVVRDRVLRLDISQPDLDLGRVALLAVQAGGLRDRRRRHPLLDRLFAVGRADEHCRAVCGGLFDEAVDVGIGSDVYTLCGVVEKQHGGF